MNHNIIKKLESSNVKNKRYKIIMNDGKIFNFGLKGGSTYIDHHNLNLKTAYQKRHLGNITENHLIKNLIPSPSLFSYYILWGPHTSVNQNIKYLNNLWNK
jgi:hypothetical protein